MHRFLGFMTEENQTPNSQPDPEKANSERSWMIQLGRYSQIGFVLPAATFAGWGLGTLLDKWLHFTWLYLAGLLIGIASGFVYLIQLVSDHDSDGGAR